MCRNDEKGTAITKRPVDITLQVPEHIINTMSDRAKSVIGGNYCQLSRG